MRYIEIMQMLINESDLYWFLVSAFCKKISKCLLTSHFTDSVPTLPPPPSTPLGGTTGAVAGVLIVAENHKHRTY